MRISSSVPFRLTPKNDEFTEERLQDLYGRQRLSRDGTFLVVIVVIVVVDDAAG